MHCLTQHKNVVAAAPAQAVADGRLAAVVLRRVDHEHAAADGRVDRARYGLVRRALGTAETEAWDGKRCRLGHDCEQCYVVTHICLGRSQSCKALLREPSVRAAWQ